MQLSAVGYANSDEYWNMRNAANIYATTRRDRDHLPSQQLQQSMSAQSQNNVLSNTCQGIQGYSTPTPSPSTPNHDWCPSKHTPIRTQPVVPSNSQQTNISATLPPSSRTARGSQVCCVFLLNKTCLALQVEDLQHVTAGQILQQIADAPCEPNIGQDACLAFAVWIANQDFELQLEPGRAPYDVYKIWAQLMTTYCDKKDSDFIGEPKLILQRNVTLGEDEERTICQRNSSALELLYHEARCNVLDGRYPVTEQAALRLAAFQAAVELDGHSAADTLYEQAGRFLPHRHLKKTFFGQNIEKKLVQEYKDLLMCRSTDKQSLMRDYLDVCRKLVFYGSAFYEGCLDGFFGDRKIKVAINRRGLHILTMDGRLEASYIFSVAQYPPMFTWDFGRPILETNEPCLYVTDGYSSSHQIFSKQAYLMDKMLMLLQPSKL